MLEKFFCIWFLMIYINDWWYSYYKDFCDKYYSDIEWLMLDICYIVVWFECWGGLLIGLFYFLKIKNSSI